MKVGKKENFLFEDGWKLLLNLKNELNYFIRHNLIIFNTNWEYDNLYVDVSLIKSEETKVADKSSFI